MVVVVRGVCVCVFILEERERVFHVSMRRGEVEKRKTKWC